MSCNYLRYNCKFWRLYRVVFDYHGVDPLFLIEGGYLIGKGINVLKHTTYCTVAVVAGRGGRDSQKHDSLFF